LHEFYSHLGCPNRPLQYAILRSYKSTTFLVYKLIANDVEDQGQDQPWLSKVRSAIQSYKNDAAHELLIPKVPNYLRVPPEQFTPRDWRFGLHNRQLHTRGTEGLKISVAGEWDNFCNDVVQNDYAAGLLRLYGLQDGFTKFSESEVNYLLVLDALYLVTRDILGFGGIVQLDHYERTTSLTIETEPMEQ